MSLDAKQMESNVAEELLTRLDSELKHVTAIMDEAFGLGFQVIWDSIAVQQNGRHGVVNLRLVKVYKR